MNKLKFTLKQHTPIIHFLHDQPGATLRATELKPKLDKFLIAHAFNDDFAEYKTHLIGWSEGKQETDFEGKESFDYKVKINSGQTINFDIEIMGYNKKKGVDTERQFPLFFGNMGKNDAEKKRFIFTSEPVMVEIFSLNLPLLEEIRKHFARFIFETNFGSRQSKGFGSFSVDENDRDITKLKRKYKFSSDVKIPIDTTNPNSVHSHFSKLFSDIELLYKSLRSGINFNFYFKSLMFKYAFDHDTQWDKKTIKETFFNVKPDKLSSSLQKKLMRDVLGLSLLNEWGKKKNYAGAIITKEHNDIERFKSPIMFKILRIENSLSYNIFLLNDPFDVGFTNQTFTIKSSNSSDELTLLTPEKFDVDYFLTYVITQIDLESHVDTFNKKTFQFKILKRIFNELKTNLEAYHG